MNIDLQKVGIVKQPLLSQLHEDFSAYLNENRRLINEIQKKLHKIIDREKPESEKEGLIVDSEKDVSKHLIDDSVFLTENNTMLCKILDHISEII